MNNPTISAVAAIGKNRELGKNGKLIWNIAEDMKHFKEITSGHAVIMGRKTYESIGRPLSNRTNIIITRNSDFTAQGCIVVQSIDEAISEAKKYDTQEVFIIGGGEIYKQAINLTNKLYLTIVNESAQADTFFPEYSDFSLFEKKEICTKSKHHISFCIYQR